MVSKANMRFVWHGWPEVRLVSHPLLLRTEVCAHSSGAATGLVLETIVRKHHFDHIGHRASNRPTSQDVFANFRFARRCALAPTADQLLMWIPGSAER